VSLGCGTVAPAPRKRFGFPGIDNCGVLVECACAVDRVHEALATTLSMVPGVKYYRRVLHEGMVHSPEVSIAPMRVNILPRVKSYRHIQP